MECETKLALSALAGTGAGVLAPPAAIALTTAFGTASTGVAISTLTGIAAESAAMAALGGGAVAVGGGGIVAGAAALAFLGPFVGIGIGLAVLIGCSGKRRRRL